MSRRSLDWLGIASLLWAGAAGAITLPPDFVSESVAPGTTFNVPTAIAFTPTGRILVSEKRGRVYAIRNGLKEGPLLDLSTEVLENGDRGLLGIAIDPQFTTNRFVYLLYTVDPDSNGIDTDSDAYGRLTRYQVSALDSTQLDPASRTILLGATWRTGIPRGSDSHSEGALRWGRDGSLLVSCGEGAQYNDPDAGGFDPGLFGPMRTDPAEDIGHSALSPSRVWLARSSVSTPRPGMVIPATRSMTAIPVRTALASGPTACAIPSVSACVRGPVAPIPRSGPREVCSSVMWVGSRSKISMWPAWGGETSAGRATKGPRRTRSTRMHTPRIMAATASGRRRIPHRILRR